MFEMVDNGDALWDRGYKVECDTQQFVQICGGYAGIKCSIAKVLYSGGSFDNYDGDTMVASVPVVNVEANKFARCPFGTELEVIYSVDGDG